MADVSVLEVMLYGAPIGTLTRVAGDRTLFAFSDAYVHDRRRPVLSLGFRDAFGELITDFRATRTRLLPFFSNLLPEGPLRSYLAERAEVNPVREFFLLRALGEDLPGAVVVRPVEGEWSSRADDVPENGAQRSDEEPLRFSLAGLQLKFSAVSEAAGLTIPARGVGGSWIVKLPSPAFDRVPENEYSMMTLARLAGMDVPRMQLVDVAAIGNLPPRFSELDGQALAIERFDRLPDGRALHIEDFAQVFGAYPEDKYRAASARSIGRVIGAEGSTEDVAEFIRRLTFNTLIGNADMHLKNWSLIYRDGRTASLAPAYDFVSTIAYLPDPTAALNFSRTKRFDAFTEDELAHLAAKALLPEKLVLDSARETVALFHQHWAAEKGNLPLPRNAVRAIDDHVRTVPVAAAGRSG